MPLPENNKFVVIDTNCFVRFLDWGPRPLLGKQIGSFYFVVNQSLFNEVVSSIRLKEIYPTLYSSEIINELHQETLKFSKKEQAEIQENANDFRITANALISSHCTANKIKVRTLSNTDAMVWATALQVQGIIATDEWPLKFSSETIPFDDEGNTLNVWTSAHILKNLEENKMLTSNERWNIVRSWKLEGEHLHRDFDSMYLNFFSEAPPSAQSSKKP